MSAYFPGFAGTRGTYKQRDAQAESIWVDVYSEISLE